MAPQGNSDLFNQFSSLPACISLPSPLLNISHSSSHLLSFGKLYSLPSYAWSFHFEKKNHEKNVSQWQLCRFLSENHTQWSMTIMHLVNDTNASRRFMICTRLGAVNDKYAFSQWQICRLLSLNHTQCSCIFVIDYGQWQICRLLSLNHTQCSMHICHWLRSMTNMQATESKSQLVFNAYLSLTAVNDKYAGCWV